MSHDSQCCTSKLISDGGTCSANPLNNAHVALHSAL